MNPLDNFLPPPEPIHLSEEQEAEIQRHYIQQRKRILQHQRRRQKRMASQEAVTDSDSEVDQLNKGVRDGKMDLTPAGSTPKEELVKLDP